MLLMNIKVLELKSATAGVDSKYLNRSIYF